jgi:hypothetical protein
LTILVAGAFAATAAGGDGEGDRFLEAYLDGFFGAAFGAGFLAAAFATALGTAFFAAGLGATFAAAFTGVAFAFTGADLVREDAGRAEAAAAGFAFFTGGGGDLAAERPRFAGAGCGAAAGFLLVLAINLIITKSHQAMIRFSPPKICLPKISGTTEIRTEFVYYYNKV